MSFGSFFQKLFQSQSEETANLDKSQSKFIDKQMEVIHSYRQKVFKQLKEALVSQIEDIESIFEEQLAQLTSSLKEVAEQIKQDEGKSDLEQSQSSSTLKQNKENFSFLLSQKDRIRSLIQKNTSELWQIKGTLDIFEKNLHTYLKTSVTCNSPTQKSNPNLEESQIIFQEKIEKAQSEMRKRRFYSFQQLTSHERQNINGKYCINKIIELENDFYAAADQGGYVVIWKFGDTNSKPYMSLQHRAAILGNSMVQINEEVLCVGDQKGYLYVWNYIKGELIYEIQIGISFRAMCRIDPITIGYAAADGNLVVFNLKQKTKVWSDKSSDLRWINVIERLAPDLLVTGSCNIDIWCISEKQIQCFLNTGDQAINCLAKIGNTQIVIGKADKKIEVWDFVYKQRTQTMEGHDQSVFAVVPLDYQTVVSISSDSYIKFWDIEWKNKLDEAQRQQMFSATFFKNDLLIVGDIDGSVQVFLIQYDNEQQK